MKQGSQLTYFSAADMSILQTGATMELERLFGYNFAAAWTGAGAGGAGSFNGGAGGQGLITIWAHYQ